ncbi:hypothetical protein SAMN05192551_101466 [Tindallia magadiensis]|uniref:Uncharacterized protein n=1 Tax=Tindallia magadiensis TaxID=69895 RepID=A0A1I3AXP6_9FIRM|nr:hypothetical protein SAMN05192551_101466 [Tindallia magadiensis]
MILYRNLSEIYISDIIKPLLLTEDIICLEGMKSNEYWHLWNAL